MFEGAHNQIEFESTRERERATINVSGWWYETVIVVMEYTKYLLFDEVYPFPGIPRVDIGQIFALRIKVHEKVRRDKGR